jgi:hypothetical protein
MFCIHQGSEKSGLLSAIATSPRCATRCRAATLVLALSGSHHGSNEVGAADRNLRPGRWLAVGSAMGFLLTQPDPHVDVLKGAVAR